MPIFKEEILKENCNPNNEFVLSCDIGGTNSRLALVDITNKTPEIISILYFKSKTLKDFIKPINQVLDYFKEKYNIKLIKAVFAVAGKISGDNKSVCVTNLGITLDLDQILKETQLQQAHLLNDFQAISYGLKVLPPESIIQVTKNIKPSLNSNSVIIGAGTGLGASVLVWDNKNKTYLNVASEAGHTDFAIQDQDELELAEFIKQNRAKDNDKNLECEELVSGSGISNIYKYLEEDMIFEVTPEHKEIIGEHYSSVLISETKHKDVLSKNTFKYFTKFYARLAKNMALNNLASGGIFIVGKLSAQNLEIFQTDVFFNEFLNSFKFESFLKQVPIFVVMDYNVGLLGAASFLIK